MELEGKVSTVDKKFSGFVKNTDYSAEITKIKNDYTTNASLDSRLNDLKAQHISTEVKKIDDKTKKNASDILRFESRLKQKEDIVDEGQRENSFTRGFYYLQLSYLVYECKVNSFSFRFDRITVWKSAGIYNDKSNSNMAPTTDSDSNLPELKTDGRMYVSLSRNYFFQNKVIIPNNNNVINIYCVYQLDPISSMERYHVCNSKFFIWSRTNY